MAVLVGKTILWTSCDQEIFETHLKNYHSEGGGETLIWNRRGCSSEILNLTLKETIWTRLKNFVTPMGDQSGHGSSFLLPVKETNLGIANFDPYKRSNAVNKTS